MPDALETAARYASSRERALASFVASNAIHADLQNDRADVILGGAGVGRRTERFSSSAPAGTRISDLPQGHDVTTVQAKDYVDARVSEAIAVQRAEIARLDSKIDGLITKVDHLPSFRAILLTAVSVALGSLALVYGALQYGSSTFGLGMSTGAAIQEAVKAQSLSMQQIIAAQADRDVSQDQKLEQVNEKLDLILLGLKGGGNQ